MKYAICALVFLSSCGVEVTGFRDVKVTHEINVDSIKPYITAYCEIANTDPEDITACVNLEIGKLIGKL